MSTNSTAVPRRLYRVESYYRSSCKPDVYYVVASGSTAAENAVLAHEKIEYSGYFRTEQVAEQRSDDFSPVPHALLFELAGPPVPPCATPAPAAPQGLRGTEDEILENIKWGTPKPTS